jgi:LuxR family maltose regulon positive regulatory protein
VLNRQPPHIQDFLLKTSILERMCSDLCDAILQDTTQKASETLEHIREANLFLIPLDHERRWYRYHHLFGDLLRKRLGQIPELHLRASQWYEENGFELEAFQHATAANDIQRAEQLINGSRVPLYFLGLARPVLHWLESLSTETLNNLPEYPD